MRCDGFHVTSWLVSDWLTTLDSLPTEVTEMLSRIGEALNDRRYEALVFKKNAGKYVGNYNYRLLQPLTRRADMLLLAGLGLCRDDVVEILEFVARVRSINESAGEKGIPAKLKARYSPAHVSPAEADDLYARIDEFLMSHYGYSQNDVVGLTSVL
jgi:hypothetical protein